MLDDLATTEDKKKALWREIYENAVSDRERASILFTEAYKTMGGGTNDHATLGTTMTKYLERMCKSNDQILQLSDIISKAEEQSSKIDPASKCSSLTSKPIFTFNFMLLPQPQILRLNSLCYSQYTHHNYLLQQLDKIVPNYLMFDRFQFEP